MADAPNKMGWEGAQRHLVNVQGRSAGWLRSNWLPGVGGALAAPRIRRWLPGTLPLEALQRVRMAVVLHKRTGERSRLCGSWDTGAALGAVLLGGPGGAGPGWGAHRLARRTVALCS